MVCARKNYIQNRHILRANAADLLPYLTIIKITSHIAFLHKTLYKLSNILSHRLYSRRLAPQFLITHKSAVNYKNAKKNRKNLCKQQDRTI